jgi:hypothetical protein
MSPQPIGSLAVTWKSSLLGIKSSMQLAKTVNSNDNNSPNNNSPD